jgi:short-subunit dehydrogenase
VGASRGLGDALASGLPDAGDRVWLVSRTRPSSLELNDNVTRAWIPADLADPGSATVIASGFSGSSIDVLVYNAGVWERGAFEDASPEEISQIVQVNLASLLQLLRLLLPALISASAAKVFLIGSTCGLENEGTQGIAYAATKFAMRGVAHSLRELLRRHGIAVTCLSPGSVASAVPWTDGPDAALDRYQGRRMPVHDLVALLRCIRNLSPASCVKEVQMPAMADPDV